jgi:pilus assembly protein CpaE
MAGENSVTHLNGSNRIRVQVVGDSETQRAEVKAILGEISEARLEVVEATQHGAAEGGMNVDLALIFCGGTETPAYLSSYAKRSSRPRLVALMSERSPVAMRRALRAGADEVLFVPLEIGDVNRMILQLIEEKRRGERGGDGVIYSVASLSGGVGTTTVAGNLAIAFSRLLGKQTALVDFDLQNGGLNVFLHVQPEQTIAPLVKIASKLDSMKLEAALTEHSSGVHLLAAPRGLEDSELVTDLAVGPVLRLMRRMFDCVVVDCGSHVDEISVAAWEHSDELLYVLDQTEVAARMVPRFMQLFASLGMRRLEPRLVLNKFEPHSTTTEEQLGQLAGKSIYATLARDERALERAQLRTQDLWQVAQGSAVARSFEQFARRLKAPRENRETVVVPASNLVSRLIGAIGARA